MEENLVCDHFSAPNNNVNLYDYFQLHNYVLLDLTFDLFYNWSSIEGGVIRTDITVLSALRTKVNYIQGNVQRKQFITFWTPGFIIVYQIQVYTAEADKGAKWGLMPEKNLILLPTLAVANIFIKPGINRQNIPKFWQIFLLLIKH